MALTQIRAAFETALAAMPGIIPDATIATSKAGNLTIFTTVAPHNFKTGLSVTLKGHSVQALNGTYQCTVTGANSFTLAALVNGVAVGSVAGGTGGTVSANLIAWEGVNFPTLSRTPYQKVNLVPLAPENPTFGGNFFRERGLFQITLIYPIQFGPGPVTERAELVQATFPRGMTMNSAGILVNVMNTPAILAPVVYEENIEVAVRIQYRADIFQ